MNTRKLVSALLMSLVLLGSANATTYFHLTVVNGAWPGELFMHFCHLNATHEDVPELFDNMVLECYFDDPSPMSDYFLMGRPINTSDDYHLLMLGSAPSSPYACPGFISTTGLAFVRWRANHQVDSDMGSMGSYVWC
jgi:hypothetical protein